MGLVMPLLGHVTLSSLTQLFHLNGTDTYRPTPESYHEGHVRSLWTHVLVIFWSSPSFFQKTPGLSRRKQFAKMANKGNSECWHSLRATLNLPTSLFPKEGTTHSTAVWAKLSCCSYGTACLQAGNSVRKSSYLVSLPSETISLFSWISINGQDMGINGVTVYRKGECSDFFSPLAAAIPPKKSEQVLD